MPVPRPRAARRWPAARWPAPRRPRVRGAGGGWGRRLPGGPGGFEHILLADAPADPGAVHGGEVDAVLGRELADERGHVGPVARCQRRHLRRAGRGRLFGRRDRGGRWCFGRCCRSRGRRRGSGVGRRCQRGPGLRYVRRGCLLHRGRGRRGWRCGFRLGLGSHGRGRRRWRLLHGRRGGLFDRGRRWRRWCGRGRGLRLGLCCHGRGGRGRRLLHRGRLLACLGREQRRWGIPGRRGRGLVTRGRRGVRLSRRRVLLGGRGLRVLRRRSRSRLCRRGLGAFRRHHQSRRSPPVRRRQRRSRPRRP